MIHRHKWTTEGVEPDGGRAPGQCRDCTRCSAHQCYTIVDAGRRKIWITTRYRKLGDECADKKGRNELINQATHGR